MLSRDLPPLAAKLIETLAASWNAESAITVENLLKQHGSETDARIAIPLIYEELCLREEQGEAVDRKALLARFPQWKSQLAMLLECYDMLAAPARSVEFPAVGEELGEFELITEIGRGGAGRVYLAKQSALSNRHVVLKVTPLIGEEHLSLARLQHSAIVPVYGMHEFQEKGLRALCMPFLGGLSLSHVLEALQAIPPGRRSGKDIADLLEQKLTTDPESVQFRGPAIKFLSTATYNQAICWIGACLADALHYAHERGLLHLDVKPSNVLLASDGQPMLLDFHLAQDAAKADSGRVDQVGGTLGYMAPEHRRLFESLREGHAPSIALDRRTDIYSLGVMLYELLFGFIPMTEEKTATQTAETNDPNQSELRSIIACCLKQKPDQRFQNAEELSIRLRKCLADPGRRHVANLPSRSFASISRSWQAGLTATLWVVSLLALHFYLSRVHQAEMAQALSRDMLNQDDFEDAIIELRNGLDQIAWLPATNSLRQSLESRIIEVKRAESAHELHRVVIELQRLDLSSIPIEQLRQFDSLCQQVWNQRTMLAQQPDLPSTTQVQSDLHDLESLWEQLKVRLRPSAPQTDPARQAESD